MADEQKKIVPIDYTRRDGDGPQDDADGAVLAW